MKKQIIFLVFFLATVVVISGCQKGIKNEEVRIKNEPEKNNQEVATTTEEIDTSDWQTYRNEEYGFEVKYPEGWKIIFDRKITTNDFLVLVSQETEKNIADAKKKNIVELPSGDIVIKVYNSENLDLFDFINKEKQNFEIISYDKVTINNYLAYSVTTGGFSKNYSVFLKNKNKIIRLYFDLKENEKDLSQVEKQIIYSVILF